MLGVFFDGWVSAELLAVASRDFGELGDDFLHVDGDPDRPGLVGDGSVDRLPDPPGRIRGEFKPAFVLEFLNRFNEPQASFLDQIGELKGRIQVLFGDGHHKAEVCPDELELIDQDRLFELADLVVNAKQGFLREREVFFHALQPEDDIFEIDHRGFEGRRCITGRLFERRR